MRDFDNGFDIAPYVFEHGELDSIINELASASLQPSRAGMRHLLAVPTIATVAQHPKLMELAAAALRCDPIPFGATFFDKSSTANWLVVWHQDTALPLKERRDVPGWGPWSTKAGISYAHAPQSALSQVIALRIHLDASTHENGNVYRGSGRSTYNAALVDSLVIKDYNRHFAACASL